MERDVAVHTTDFEGIYDKYSPILYRIALSHLCDVYDAEHAVQDTFISYFSHQGKFTSDDHLKAWLIRVVINKAHDERRRQKIREYTPFHEIAEIESEQTEDLGVLEQVMILPEKYKTPLILHYFEDIAVEKIAEILGISISGAKMRLKRGRDMLREKLEQEEEDLV